MTTNDYNEQKLQNDKLIEINRRINSVAQDLSCFKFGSIAFQLCFLVQVINIIKLGKPLSSDSIAFSFNIVMLLASVCAWKVSLNCESTLSFRLSNSLDTMKGTICYLDKYLWYYSFCIAYALHYQLPDNLSDYKIWISIGILLVCKKIFTTVSGINRLKRLLKDPYIALGFKLGLDKNDTATSEKYMAYTLLLNIAMAGVLLYWALKGMPHLVIFK